MSQSQVALGRDKMLRVVDMTIEHLKNPKALVEGVLPDEDTSKSPFAPTPERLVEMFLSYSKATDEELATWARSAALAVIALSKTEADYTSFVEGAEGFKGHLMRLVL